MEETDPPHAPVLNEGGGGDKEDTTHDNVDSRADKRVKTGDRGSDGESSLREEEETATTTSGKELPNVVPKQKGGTRSATPPPPSVKEYEAISPNTRQMVGQKRGRERRGALLPNTMTAKLVEQAAERHRIAKKAESEGRVVEEEELDLCGIAEQMQKAGGTAGGGLVKDESGILEEEDIVFSKRQRRGS
ncbi:hypothetical protein TrLO_g10281 [Triparma laevis f. longispina]|uniref:Uncharacterized protein n=1 Tax=Triparma laevis f. longispina TaxID=1714387 RepID=A0A9W7KXT2_9STRA|nr:hypothetical protein TrLO_g10281 [Triparma laevis f. longispina]